MAEMLGLHSSTVSHHLARLARIGLVSDKAEGDYSIYQLETKILKIQPAGCCQVKIHQR
jgi:predicted transcriptional regulator